MRGLAVTGVLFFGIWSFEALHAEVVAPRGSVRHLFQRVEKSLTLPRIALLGETIVFASSLEEKIFLYSLKEPDAKPEVLPAGMGITSVAVHPSGWVGVCHDLGAAITQFHVKSPHKIKKINFDPEITTLGCADLEIDGINRFGNPIFWTGSTGDQKVIRLTYGRPFTERGATLLMEGISPFNFTVLKTYGPVSGPFNLRVTPSYVFALNGSTSPHKNLPFVLDRVSGKGVVGDSSGMGSESQTGLKREYSDLVFQDQKSDSVFYAKPRVKQLVRFSRSQPSELTMEEIQTSIPWIASLARSGSCILALGYDEKSGFPLVGVLKQGNDGKYFQSERFPLPEDPKFIGNGRLWVDETGTLVLSHFYGLSLISGALGASGCD